MSDQKEEPIKNCDVVKLKSGSVKMTVGSYIAQRASEDGTPSYQWHCQWQVEGVAYSETYWPEQLIKVGWEVSAL